jgi:hypothetical protein
MRRPYPTRWPARLRTACGTVAAFIGLTIATPACGEQAGARQGGPPGSGRNPAALVNSEPTQAEFRKRLDAYVSLQQKLAGQLPPVPDEATPEQIDGRQRQLAKAIASARQSAEPGDIFTPPMQDFVRELLARVFGGPTGKQLRSTIMDENPIETVPGVNARYPDNVPMSTMPPAVLEALPELPEDIEYRFLGETLILLDVQAHVIVDFVPKALPKV